MAVATEPKVSKKRVTFQIEAPQAEAVYVSGCFNSWELTRHALKKDAKGVWKAQVMLTPGVYEYRYIVDGEWSDDPAAAATIQNPFGTVNAVREV